jgi:hypothetical protein
LVFFVIFLATQANERWVAGNTMYGHLKSAWFVGGVLLTDGSGEGLTEGGGTDEMTGEIAGVLDGNPEIGTLDDDGRPDGPSDPGGLSETVGTDGPVGTDAPGVPLPLTTDEQATAASATAEAANTNRMRTISLREPRLSGRP